MALGRVGLGSGLMGKPHGAWVGAWGGCMGGCMVGDDSAQA